MFAQTLNAAGELEWTVVPEGMICEHQALIWLQADLPIAAEGEEDLPLSQTLYLDELHDGQRDWAYQQALHAIAKPGNKHV